MLTRISADRNSPADADKILKEVNVIIDTVNKTLLTYQRISKVTILAVPLEMTTTKKVKRIYKK